MCIPDSQDDSSCSLSFPLPSNSFNLFASILSFSLLYRNPIWTRLVFWCRRWSGGTANSFAISLICGSSCRDNVTALDANFIVCINLSQLFDTSYRFNITCIVYHRFDTRQTFLDQFRWHCVLHLLHRQYNSRHCQCGLFVSYEKEV